MIAEATKCFVRRLWFLGLFDQEEFIILELLSGVIHKLFFLNLRISLLCFIAAMTRVSDARQMAAHIFEFLFLYWTMLSRSLPLPLYLPILLTPERMIVAAGPLRVDLVAYQIGALLQTLLSSSERANESGRRKKIHSSFVGRRIARHSE